MQLHSYTSKPVFDDLIASSFLSTAWPGLSRQGPRLILIIPVDTICSRVSPIVLEISIPEGL